MSVAAAVVANPVIAPRADLQIPAIALSGTGDAMDMLNNDFLSAIGPTQAEPSSNPYAVLKDLVSSLAADATYLTKNAIVTAFFAGATAVTNPQLTAASFPYNPASSFPYIPGSAGPVGPVALPSSAGPAAVAGPVPVEQLLAAASLPADLAPAAAEVVTSLMDSLPGLNGSAMVMAAFAAGALLMTEGGQVIDTVSGLVDHGVQGALTDILTAVGSGEPQTAIISAIRSVIEQPLPATPSAVIPSAVVPPADATAIAHQASTGADMPTSPTLRAGTIGAEGVQLPRPPSDSRGVLPHPAAGLIDAAISLSDGLKNGIDATTRVRIPARPAPTNDAITDARNKAPGVLHNVADAMGKAADHAAKAVTGPTRN